MRNTYNRRQWLQNSTRLGGMALSSMLMQSLFANANNQEGKSSLPKGTHHPAKVKSIIFLYMDGGPSHIDTFDPKPALIQHHGKNPAEVLGKVEPTQFANIGKVMQSPWKFKQHGQSGAWISDLFPRIAECADDLTFIKSMTSKFSEHTSANYFLHTGNGIQGRPSWGAWLGYGLGSGNDNFPTFVVINGGLIPPGGLDNFNSGFLPAAFQGSILKAKTPPLANVTPLEKETELQEAKKKLISQFDTLNTNKDAAIQAAITNYETAYRMQLAVPELMEFHKESKATQSLYGMDSTYAHTVTFAKQCLLARRLVERGVKFIELTCPFQKGHDRWDQHYRLREGHEDNARAVDQPIAGLIKDLKAKGLLEQTLIVWGGEFGRTPFAQGTDGRDHNPFGFTIWMAGGGIKPGISYGKTDEFGYKAIENKVEIHDLHATMLHLIGVDHTKQTFRFGGRDMRLTDVHGEVIKPILS